MGHNSIVHWAVKSKNVLDILIKREVITLNPVIKSRGVVLLSYLTNPFRFHISQSFLYSHTNQWECVQIAQAWMDKGYSVDVIDWNNDHFIPKKDYSVFIDIHSNMERLAPLMNENCLKILHITGAHWLFQNTAEYSRLLSLQKRKKISLIPRRTVQPSKGIECADCATVLGNAFTQGTFEYSGKPMYPIHISTNIQFPFLENKDFDKVRNNYLWFGGGGLVHKGLDLVLETFAKLPEYQLTVCGSINEPDFEKAYFNELYKTPNIKTIGWRDVHSSEFLEVIKNNIALIYPSCSEGGGGSVITCLHAGLIPIISYESSVDISDFGIVLRDSTIEEIKTAIKKTSSLSDLDLKKNSKKSWDFARKYHTQELFKKEYNNFVEIMSSYNEVKDENPL
jgi:glycosyltransferase involved in cell wall biosynthesis